MNEDNTGKTTSAEPAKHWNFFLSVIPYLGIAVLAVIGLGLAAAIVWGLFSPTSIVRELGNADLARGVITFIFAVGTIGIALLLTFGALLGGLKPEDFANAKGVLTVLIGVFGTILGFYFGTANGGGQKLDVAEIKLADKQLITHISGGTRPYRYSITPSDKAFAPIENKVSDDGWIIETLPEVPKPTSVLTVDATDDKDQKASRTLNIPGDAKSSPTPPATKPETAPPK
ncbi:MAG TPA: hypothetical protein VNY07_13800 [Chthoniobacterales bacterium]|jgi:hypothetical protein|nr:hypothetical protein [Chthoniobacterales bacterium]